MTVPADRDAQPVRPFGAFTADLYALAEWLRQGGIDTVAMASTGVYGIPLFEVLEERGFEVLLVDPRLVKQIPGRNTDGHDGQWRQELHSDGLLRGAFRPEEQVCTLRRDLRQRSLLMTSAARAVPHRQKALEQMNLQLTEVVNDIMGNTGRGIIRAILAGERAPQRLVLRRDRRCTPDTATIAKALEGHWLEEHLFALQQAVDLGDVYQQQIQACKARIETCLQEFERQGEASATPLAPSPRARHRHGHAPTFAVRASLDAITGVDLTRIDGIEALTALKLISEIGLEMTRWPTVTHVASWLGRCPGTTISGGKRYRCSSSIHDTWMARAFGSACRGYFDKIRSSPCRTMCSKSQIFNIYLKIEITVSYVRIYHDELSFRGLMYWLPLIVSSLRRLPSVPSVLRTHDRRGVSLPQTPATVR